MKKRKIYRRWRSQAYKLLSSRQRIQKKSITKIQRKIAGCVYALNHRDGKVRTWSFDEVSAIALAAIFHACPYCKERIHWFKWSLDHKKPVERGGTNRKKNIQVICSRCNRAKGTVAHKPFKKILRFMRRWPNAYKELLKRLAYGGSFHVSKK